MYSQLRGWKVPWHICPIRPNECTMALKVMNNTRRRGLAKYRSKALWQQMMSAVWTKADNSVVSSFDKWLQRKKGGEKMSLITWNWQEASVFIIISAKVSVMDLECSWETSARNWAKGKDERPVAFPPPPPDFLTKCRHRLSWNFYPPGWSSGQILVASGSWNILDFFFLIHKHDQSVGYF